MVRLATIGAFALLATLSAPAVAQNIEGFATAIDGDTIDMTGALIRLAHIDAPEPDQTCKREGADWNCGKTATDELASLIEGKRLVCTVMNGSARDAMVAECQTDVFSLGREMARRGFTVVSDKAPYSYIEASQTAQRLNYGLWASTFDLPSQWRYAHPKEPVPALSSSTPQELQGPIRPAPEPPSEPVFRNEFGCAIKGNRSRRGEWIYHLPGRPYYEQTRPEELFCTESEAQAAGYRRSKA